MVFCFGALTDPILPPAPYNVEAEQYFQLTRAAMNVEPVIDRPPSVVTVQTLSLMGIYQVRSPYRLRYNRELEVHVTLWYRVSWLMKIALRVPGLLWVSVLGWHKV